jgi:hypothetical protein
MRWSATWLVTTALLALACAQAPDEPINLPPGGSGSTGSGSSVAAKQFYLEKVHPAFDLTCTWCHAAAEAGQQPPGDAPQWLSLDPEQAYANIEAYGGLIAHPENSIILLQGEHMGPALVPKQDILVREWLMLEVAERGLPNPDDNTTTTSTGSGSNPPGLTAEDALNQFSACMDLQTYDDTQMYLVAHQQTTGWGPCRGCHNTGWAGAFLDDNQELTFDMNKQRPYLLKLVTVKVENGAFIDLEQSNRFRNKGVEPCSYLEDTDPANDIYCHPKYVLNPNVDTAVTAFYDATYTAWKNGECGMVPMGEGGAGGAGGAPP